MKSFREMFINEAREREWDDQGKISSNMWAIESGFKIDGKFLNLVRDNKVFTWNLIKSTGEIHGGTSDEYKTAEEFMDDLEIRFDLDFNGKDRVALKWIKSMEHK